MRIFVPIAIFLLVASRLTAQITPDSLSTDNEARRILDEPGVISEDPDEVFEYLDDLPPQSGNSLTLRHANPETSWIAAHKSLRSQETQSYDSATLLLLRSRGGRTFGAYDQHGYTSNQYLGSPNSYYNRVKGYSNILTFSVLQQKQSWEPHFADQLNGFASLSHPIDLGSHLRIENATVGDYALAFGNGLLFGEGIASAKSFAAASAAEGRSFGIRGSLSNNPMQSFRGAAAEIGVGNASLTLFASDRPIDAHIVNDTIRTFYTTDYHRTIGELATEDAAGIRTLGFHASISNDDTSSLYLRAGATAYELRYDHPYAGSNGNPFVGSTVRSASTDILAIGTKFSTTTEVAYASDDTAQHIAFSTSWLFQPSKDIGLAIVYHYIPYGFISPFGEIAGSAIHSLANSDGIYFGVQGTPIDHILHVSGYAEFVSALLPVSDLFPKQKHDYLAASYLTLLQGMLKISATVRSQSNVNIATIQSASNAVYATVLTDRTSIRFEGAYDNDGPFSEKTRYERVGVSSITGDESGFLLMQELGVRVGPAQTKFSVTASRFQADSYASAIYLYEPGVPGTAASTPLDGKGWHFSIRT